MDRAAVAKNVDLAIDAFWLLRARMRCVIELQDPNDTSGSQEEKLSLLVPPAAIAYLYDILKKEGCK